MKETTVVIEMIDGFNKEVQTLRVRHAEGTKASALMRAAVADYFSTYKEEANIDLDGTGGWFNWGDALSAIPDEVWRKNGVEFLDDHTEDEYLDHDENLVPAGFVDEEEG